MLVNMLTVNKLTKLNKQTKNSKISSGTQAEVSAPPVEAGPAVTAAPVPPPAPQEAPKAPETPQKIDYDDFVAKTTQPPPKRNVAASGATEELFRTIKNGHTVGEFFVTDDPTDSLYAFLQFMEGKEVLDPYPKKGKPPENISMVKAFEKYIRALWELHQKHYDGKQTVNDFVLHRAAFIFVMQDYTQTYSFYSSPERFVKVANRDRGKVSLYSKMVCMVKDYFIEAGWGWDETPLSNKVTYKAEQNYVKYYKLPSCRDEMFPSYLNDRGYRSHDRKPPKIPQQRIDPTPTLFFDKPVDPVLESIAENLGVERFDLWFGQDTHINIDESKKEVELSVRSNYVLNAINQRCKPEVLAAIEKHKPGFKSAFVVRPPPVTNREQEIEQMRKLTTDCNVEARARKIPTADEMLSVSGEGSEFRVTMQPIPSWLSKEEQAALCQEIRQREKELFEEFTKNRNAEVALTH